MVLTWAVSRYAIDIPFTPLVGVSVLGVMLTTLTVAVIGVVASWDVLQKKPLATLRGE